MYGAEQGFSSQGGFGAPPMGTSRGNRGRGRGQRGGGFQPRGGMSAGGADLDYGYGGGANFGAPFDAGFEQSPLDAEVAVVLSEMHGEIAALDVSGEYGEQFKNARRLLTTEVDRLENNIDPEWLEVDIEKPIKLIRKILIPTFRNPRFNYVGKVLGPKGTTLQNIAKQFKCHVYILGRGSTRDRAKEEELLNSGDPNYAHYAGPLHVKVETNAPPSLAYQRVSGVLDVLQQLLQPVKDTFIPGITNPADDSEKKNGDDGDEQDDDKKDGNDDDGGPSKYVNRSGTGANRAAIGSRGGFGQRGGFGAQRGFQPRGGFQNRGSRGRGMSGGGGPMMRGSRGGNRGGFAPY